MKDIINQYTDDALRTESKIDKVKLNPMFLLSVLTIAKCAGDMLDQIKKHAFYGKEYNNERIADDVHYIVAGLEGLTQQHPNILQESELDIDPRVFHAILGIATESTEMLEALKINGDKMDSVNILEESFDIDYYQLILLDQLNADMFQVWDTGFKKLKSRYPEKFDTDNAINRDLEKEREILNNIQS